MKKKTVFELNMDETMPLRIYHFEDGGEGKAVQIDWDNLDEMAKELKCSKELLYTLAIFGSDINEAFKAVRKDMVDLYKKIDQG